MQSHGCGEPREQYDHVGILKEIGGAGLPVVAQCLTSPTSIDEDVGSIPGPAHSLNLVLLGAVL